MELHLESGELTDSCYLVLADVRFARPKLQVFIKTDHGTGLDAGSDGGEVSLRPHHVTGWDAGTQWECVFDWLSSILSPESTTSVIMKTIDYVTFQEFCVTRQPNSPLTTFLARRTVGANKLVNDGAVVRVFPDLVPLQRRCGRGPGQHDHDPQDVYDKAFAELASAKKREHALDKWRKRALASFIGGPRSQQPSGVGASSGNSNGHDL